MISLLLPLLGAALPAAGDAAPPSSILTIYSSADPAGFDPRQFVDQARAGGAAAFASQVPGFGVVRESRSLTLEPAAGGAAGRYLARFTDVAQFMDPTTVSFQDRTAAQTSVLSQSFQFDLVNPESLMQRYLDKPVRVVVSEGAQARSVEGTLLSATGGQLILQAKEGVRIIPAADARVEMGELPGGLLTRPTLVWELASPSGGAHDVSLSYQTAGLTWRADYNLILNGDDTKATINAWVTLLNLSGAGWKDAGLKLVAGDVHRVEPPAVLRKAGRPMSGFRGGAVADLGFEEKSFFEYHLYTLPRRTDILENSSQQLVLFPTATEVPVEKLLIVNATPELGRLGEPISDRGVGAGEQVKVQVFVRFLNTRDNHMGMPLPAGKVRVSKADDDGSLEFIGEDVISHTPRDEKVTIKVGNAFDVVAERTQVDFKVDTGRREMTEIIKVQVRNRKEAPAKVVVREHLYRWIGWEITAKDHDFNKVNASTIEFPISLDAGATETITYTVRYRW